MRVVGLTLFSSIKLKLYLPPHSIGLHSNVLVGIDVGDVEVVDYI